MSRAARQALSLRTAPPRAAELETRADLLWIEAQYLTPDPHQPRTEFDEESLDELARNIADIGILQPLAVRPPDPVTGIHVLTDGERRLRAGQRAGVVQYPCIVKAADATQAFFEAYSANLHRDALTPVDAAAGMQRIREAFGLAGDDEVADKLKKSVGWVRQMNAVLSLDPQTRRALRETGAPVAVAVGLRAQAPEDRPRTLEAIADVTGRDAKVDFISRVNEHRRAGASIDEAIATARAVRQNGDAPTPRAPTARPAPAPSGRPTRITLPFAWRQITPDWWDVDVHPSVLATTRLAAERRVSFAQWRDALHADLTAFRDASATADDGGQAWRTLVEALAALLAAEQPASL